MSLCIHMCLKNLIAGQASMLQYFDNFNMGHISLIYKVQCLGHCSTFVEIFCFLKLCRIY